MNRIVAKELIRVAKLLASADKEWTKAEWEAYKKEHPKTNIKPKFKKEEKGNSKSEEKPEPKVPYLYGKDKASKVKEHAKKNPKVWKALLDQAKKDKEWAEKTKDDKKWLDKASDMSKDMLKERLEKSAEDLALDHYAYLHMRAHAKSNNYDGSPIDPSARRKWQELGGKLEN